MENSNSRKTKKKFLVIAACAALVLALGAITVFAYLSGMSGSVNNTLQADVDPDPVINEEIVPTSGPGYPIKKDVSVSVGDNDYTVYVRAAIVVTWAKEDVDDNGNPVLLVHSDVPVRGIDYTLELNSESGDLDKNQWRLGTDGYYYYTSPVEGNGETGVLIRSATQVWESGSSYPVRDDGYVLRIEIVAQTIQAIGTTDDDDVLAVVDAWGVKTQVKDNKRLIYKDNNVQDPSVGDSDPIGELPWDDTFGN